MRQDIHSAGIPVLCLSCEARHKGVCGALNPDQLVELSRHAYKHSVERGEEIVGDAETVTSYSNILTGVAKLSKTMPDGRQQIVGLQFAPDFLGRPYDAESRLNVEAATDLKLCSFPKVAFDRLMEQTKGLEKRIFQQTLRELDEARDWMLTLGRKTATEKVASFLVMIARNVDPTREPDAPVAFDLPLARADIADFLGLTIETVSRQMTKLAGGGVVQVRGRHIEVPNLSRLLTLAGDQQ